MKKSLVLLAASALVVPSTQCGLGGLFNKAKEVVQQAKTLTETTRVYKANAAPNDKQFTPVSIEIRSKAPQRSWVAIKINDTIYTHNGKDITEIAPGKSVQFPVVIDKAYDIYVWNNQPGSTSDKANFKYRFNAEQTAYVNIDPDGSLRPQTGPAKGALKKTDSGFSLENNVKTMMPVAVDAPKADEPKKAPTAPTPPPMPKTTTVKEAPEPAAVPKAPEGVKSQPTSLLEEIRSRGQTPALGEEKAPAAVAAAPQVPVTKPTVAPTPPPAPPLPPKTPLAAPAQQATSPEVKTQPKDLLAEIKAGKELRSAEAREVAPKAVSKDDDALEAVKTSPLLEKAAKRTGRKGAAVKGDEDDLQKSIAASLKKRRKALEPSPAA